MPTQDEILHQKTLLATHRRTLAHYLKQQAALGEAFAPPAVAFGITETRDNIRRIKSILRGWNVQVDDHPDDGDEVQEPTPSEQAQTLPNTVDRTRMRRILTDYFNEDELRDLCFDMGIDYENLQGGGKAGKARELVAYVERYGKYQDLVKHIQHLRPNVAW